MSTYTGELSPDFAERVLQLADRRLAERRRVRWIAGVTGLCAAVVGTISWINVPQQTGVSAGNTMVVARAAPSASAESAGSSTDALSYLFPDARPLARFAAEDGEDKGAGGVEALLDDDE
jgi:hypothetical protein